MNNLKKYELVVERADNVFKLLNANALPSEEMFEKKSLNKKKYLFEIDKEKSITIEKSAMGVYTKTIRDIKNTLFIPNYIRYVERRKFSKDLKTEEKKYEIIEMRWFHNKRKHYSVDHTFMLSFAEINNFSKNFLINPTEEDIDKINSFFKKENDLKMNNTPMELLVEKDLSTLIASLEKNNENHKSFLNNAKTVSDYVSHKTTQGKYLPAKRIVFKEKIEVDESNELEDIEILFYEDKYRIGKITILHKKIIRFFVEKDDSGIKINVLTNNHKIVNEFDKEGNYFTLIKYRREYPIKIGSIQLPKIFGTLGRDHNFISAKKNEKMFPKNLRNYKNFPSFFKNDFKKIFSTVLFMYKKEKKGCRDSISDFILNEITPEMSDDNVADIIDLNYQDFNYYFRKINENIDCHDELVKTIDDYNNKKISIELVNLNASIMTKKMKII